MARNYRIILLSTKNTIFSYMKKILLLPLFSLAFWACSDNESNPVKTDVPEPPPASSETVPSSSSVVAEVPDTCGSFVDARDGQSYCTVKIGEQTWMAKNLAYALPGSVCRKDDPANCEKYGRLYSWTQAIGKTDAECGAGVDCALPAGPLQGVCPEGWFLPDSSDWMQLSKFVKANNDGESVVESLMAKDQPEWNEYVTPTDRFGFSALASAGFYNSGNMRTGSDRTGFWTRTPSMGEPTSARMFEIGPLDKTAMIWSAGKVVHYSVRCIKY